MTVNHGGNVCVHVFAFRVMLNTSVWFVRTSYYLLVYVQCCSEITLLTYCNSYNSSNLLKCSDNGYFLY